MEYKFNFKTEEEKEELIKANTNLTLIKIAYHLKENFLIFTDEEIIYDLTETEILGNKISILEAENKSLREGLQAVLSGDMQSLKISILEAENKSLREGLQAVLSGDMQSLSYILYPKDFAGVNKSNTTLEL